MDKNKNRLQSRTERIIKLSAELNKQQAEKIKTIKLNSVRIRKKKIDPDYEYQSPRKSNVPVLSSALPGIGSVAPNTKVRRWLYTDKSDFSPGPTHDKNSKQGAAVSSADDTVNNINVVDSRSGKFILIL